MNTRWSDLLVVIPHLLGELLRKLRFPIGGLSLIYGGIQSAAHHRLAAWVCYIVGWGLLVWRLEGP